MKQELRNIMTNIKYSILVFHTQTLLDMFDYAMKDKANCPQQHPSPRTCNDRYKYCTGLTIEPNYRLPAKIRYKGKVGQGLLV